MKLITPPSIYNGYSPQLTAYTKIYSDIYNSSEDFGISANSISALDTDLVNVTASNVWIFDSSYGYTNQITGVGSTIFGTKAVTGNRGIYYNGEHLKPKWAITGTWNASTYVNKFLYTSWSYEIQDAASAAISGCFAYPTNDMINKYGTQETISAYPATRYFCISAYSWNLDSENLLSNNSYLITNVNGNLYINDLTSSASGKYYWAVDLNQSQYATSNMVYWWLQVSETWSSKITNSATGNFKIDQTIDNSISGNTYGGARGSQSITGARSSLTKPLGYSGGESWIEICGVNWS